MLHALRQYARLLHIYWILLCYGLDEFLFRFMYSKNFIKAGRLNVFAEWSSLYNSTTCIFCNSIFKIDSVGLGYTLTIF